MSSTYTETRKARKAHTCSLCGTQIVAGTTYWRWCWFYDGSASTVKVHPDCGDVLHAARWCGEWDDDTLAEIVGDPHPDDFEKTIASVSDPAVAATFRKIRKEWRG